MSIQPVYTIFVKNHDMSFEPSLNIKRGYPVLKEMAIIIADSINLSRFDNKMSEEELIELVNKIDGKTFREAATITCPENVDDEILDFYKLVKPEILELYSQVIAKNINSGIIMQGNTPKRHAIKFKTNLLNKIITRADINLLVLMIDIESITIYLPSNPDLPIVYWHLDEVAEDENVAISMVNAVNLYHTDREELLERLGYKIK